MRRTDIADALRAHGCTVEEIDGWQSRGDDVFDPMGVVLHHTAGAPDSDRGSLNTCIHGRPDLSGPLCNVFLTRSGVAIVVAAGRANHAGKGSWRGVTGNSHMFGIEAENDGSQGWPAEQIDAYKRVCAALLSLTGHGVEWVCGHKEWAPGRKNDPHSIDLDGFRRDVSILLAGGGIPVPSTPPTAPVVPPFLGVAHFGLRQNASTRAVQARLRDRGWKIDVDGTFGPQTLAVVKAFQAEKHLAVDGVVGPKTWEALWVAPITK